MGERIIGRYFWLFAIIFVFILEWMIVAGPFHKESIKYNPLAVIAFIALGFLMIPAMLFWDFTKLSKPYCGQRIERLPAGMELPAPLSTFRVFFVIICAYAVMPCFFGLLAYMNGGPILITHVLSAIAVINLVYVRWRSWTYWERLHSNY